MVEIIDNVYEAFTKYFNHLVNTGYIKQKDVNKVIIFSFLEEMINTDFRGYITEDDYRTINRVLYCLFGSTCLIPYPEYYSNKVKRVMYNGSISELVHRMEEAEGKVESMLEAVETNTADIETLKDTEVVIPGDAVKEIDDIELD